MREHNCLQESVVTDSRLRHSNTVRRRRKCSICGDRFTTREVIVDSIITEDKLTPLLNRLEEFKEAIEEIEFEIIGLYGKDKKETDPT